MSRFLSPSLNPFCRPWSLLLALALTACADPAPPGPPMPTVAAVDLDRYLGTWYEISSLPNRFQASCVADTQARYRLLSPAADAPRIEVFNRCRDDKGAVESATGLAEVVPSSGNAKLRVSFFRPFWGNYWVLALDPDYRWVLVGEPRRRYGWLLARQPQLPAAAQAAAMARAAELGYTVADFKATPQRQPLD